MIDLLTDPQALMDFALDKSAKLLVSLIVIFIGYFLIKWLDNILGKLFDKTEWDEALEKFLQSLANGMAWIVVILIVLVIFGVDLGPLIASLGIMGFVIGFALKDTLGNLASGVMILIYKPFTVGNYIDAGGVSGTVKHVGISACVLNTPDNKKITVPNSAIWGNAITNFSAHKKRRMDIPVGISYNDDIDKAVSIAEKMLRKDDRILGDPEPLVVVSELGDSSVNLILRFWVKSSDFWPTKFAITQGIKQEFDRNNISIPFPQRDVHIVKETVVPKKVPTRKKAHKKISKKMVGDAED